MREVGKHKFTCDKCGSIYEYGDIENPNEMTIANKCWSFSSNHGQAGYGSQFDGSYINFDVCDNCLGKILKSFTHKKRIINSGTNYIHEEDYVEEDYLW